MEEHELYSVESEVVRYRFGPWNHRYRDFPNILVAKGLISLSIEGRKIIIVLTEDGRRISRLLTEQSIRRSTSEQGSWASNVARYAFAFSTSGPLPETQAALLGSLTNFCTLSKVVEECFRAPRSIVDHLPAEETVLRRLIALVADEAQHVLSFIVGQDRAEYTSCSKE
ncbi:MULTISPECIES: hypothetical protein [Paraburkholderia]|uniref:hypothetical protein n=1 Tax=Paraburkholderia TaxID=1822464 RepID=UPI0006B5D6D2|nr:MULTISPECIES: hypothetical protein [Paraburkholderia]MBK3744590.1 hypothetical protein [Paraburkholderia aspalathi]MBK3816258.1 hypothetical protein [Paraburkholderia aspalathi]MBK5153275.1 hypothetical protein [Burkholderia sp. R-69608]MBK5185754.1 hypothetical protein [Burkholderia sp. R-69749]